ncbi:MAG: response regulator transcription factor [Firmicutes bacterium]|nr:response regulator transcription factor [Alicyclobacillaceae bacterium]MCL6498145.1 response regulator transcription factor [Bacillota bacterium]
MEESPIRVFIVEDHEVVRAGLSGLFDSHPDIQLVGEAGTLGEAERRIPELRPDVVLLDIRLPDGSGIDLCRQLTQRFPEMHVVMLTSFGDDDLLFRSLEAGAAGYLLKTARGHTIVEAIRTAAGGGSILDPAVADKVMQRIRHPAQVTDPYEELTPQERRILELIAEGLTNREIGAQVYLSEATVKHYVSNILSKLGLSRRAEAAAYLTRRKSRSGAS